MLGGWAALLTTTGHEADDELEEDDCTRTGLEPVSHAQNHSSPVASAEPSKQLRLTRQLNLVPRCQS